MTSREICTCHNREHYEFIVRTGFGGALEIVHLALVEEGPSHKEENSGIRNEIHK